MENKDFAEELFRFSCSLSWHTIYGSIKIYFPKFGNFGKGKHDYKSTINSENISFIYARKDTMLLVADISCA